jgi:hypothetical protein
LKTKEIKETLEQDLCEFDYISYKCKNKKNYAQNLYAALCNNTFVKENNKWNCSWKKSAEIVCKLIGSNNYLDYYCSGMDADLPIFTGFVTEGTVCSEVSNDLLNLGWILEC